MTTPVSPPMLAEIKHAIAAAFGTSWHDYDGQDARTLEITFKAKGPTAPTLALEQAAAPKQVGRLRLEEGVASHRIAPGKYFLRFEGTTDAPQTPYTLRITSPDDARWEPDPDGPDARSDDACNIIGVHTLRVA